MSRFSGPMTSPGSTKTRGNKGVLKAYRLRKREEAQQRDENNRRAREVTVTGRVAAGTLKPEQPTPASDKKNTKARKKYRSKPTASSAHVQALADKFNIRN